VPPDGAELDGAELDGAELDGAELLGPFEVLEDPGLFALLGLLEAPGLLELLGLLEVLEVPGLLEPTLMLPLWPAEAPVVALVVDVESAPPQAASASAQTQHAAVNRATRNFSKAGIQ
jgi:hypothetical protein